MPGRAADKLNVMLPIEIMSRELDARLFLGCMCADDSKRVYVGQHDVLYRVAQQARGGLYVGKNIFREYPNTDFGRYETLRKNGHTLIHLDEEGAVYDGREPEWQDMLLVRLDPRKLFDDDYVCTWGAFQERHYKSLRPKCVDNIRATGHPRFDLYRPPYRQYFAQEAADLRQRYGQFVLVNTTFTAATPKHGFADLFSPRNLYHVDSVSSRTEGVEAWAHMARKQSHFVTLCNRISIECPDTQLVIRPHPGEDATLYHAAFDGVSNVHIVRDSAVAPWLFACAVLIHSGCTTGIEAWMAGTPVLQYKPVVDERYDPYLTNRFGVECCTELETLEQVRAILAGEATKPAPSLGERANSLLANLDGESFPRVLDVLREAELKHGGTVRSPTTMQLRLSEASRALNATARSAVRPLFPGKLTVYRAYKSYFPGFDRAEILARVAAVEAILDRSVRVRFLSNALFVIEAGAD